MRIEGVESPRSSTPVLFLLEKIGGFDVFVIAASLVLLNPDPDQARADVVSFREPMKGACGA
jgi:hypothetical protein